MKNETCESCVYFKEEGLYSGRCRLIPPVMLANARGDGPNAYSQPAISHDDWCGEYFEKDNTTGEDAVDTVNTVDVKVAEITAIPETKPAAIAPNTPPPPPVQHKPKRTAKK